MDKRYQVFVSSTFADLQEERRNVIQALMEMDCIPSGMELFPAADEEQFEFIKKVIDDCDYYLLIIGGRYGSTTAEGISYTEMEYDYAIENGIKVIALLHEKPADIPVGKSETDPKLVKKLEAFRKKVSNNRLVKFWKTADELAGLVALSLSKQIKMHPAVGWIRANQASNTELLNDLNELRKKKEELEIELTRLRGTLAIEIPDLASLEDKAQIFGTCTYGTRYLDEEIKKWEYETMWKEIFSLVSPYLISNPLDTYVRANFARILFEKSPQEGRSPNLNYQVFQTIKIQFQALGLINMEFEVSDSKKLMYWSLTEKGTALMMSLRTVKSTQPAVLTE